MVPKAPLAPDPPLGVMPEATVTGGQAMAQAPVQADVVEVSLENQ